MESFLPHVKTHFSSSPQFLIPNSNISATHNLQIPGVYGYAGSCRVWQPLLSTGKGYILSSKCAKGNSIEGIERKLEEQIGTEKDLARIGKSTDKYEEDGGEMVELLECLEREAIMGDDEGKEPMDYNRRAQIFDESSRVFQDVKESSETTATSNRSNSGL